mmetsp:Transcript_6379/g.7903  ORF Transcript_6379/g.7903 Transcript_6379/m.7903 type:complete len:209 (-) Transcript_6379:32-658(-)
MYDQSTSRCFGWTQPIIKRLKDLIFSDGTESMCFISMDLPVITLFCDLIPNTSCFFFERIEFLKLVLCKANDVLHVRFFAHINDFFPEFSQKFLNSHNNLICAFDRCYNLEIDSHYSISPSCSTRHLITKLFLCPQLIKKGLIHYLDEKIKKNSFLDIVLSTLNINLNCCIWFLWIYCRYYDIVNVVIISRRHYQNLLLRMFVLGYTF